MNINQFNEYTWNLMGLDIKWLPTANTFFSNEIGKKQTKKKMKNQINIKWLICYVVES